MVDFEPMPIADEQLWRVPNKMADICEQPNQIYHAASEIANVDRCVAAFYNGSVVGVASRSKMELFQLEKTPAYSKKAAIIKKLDRQIACQDQISSVVADKNNVYVQYQSYVSVFDISQCQTKQQIKPKMTIKGQEIKNLSIFRDILAFSYGNTAYYCNTNDYALNTHELRNNIMFMAPLYYNNQILLFIQQQGQIITLNTKQKTQQFVLSLNAEITCLHQSTLISELIAIGTKCGKLYIYDIRNYKLIDQFIVSADRLNTVQFSPSHPDLILAAADDNQIQVYRFGIKPMCIMDLSQCEYQYQLIEADRQQDQQFTVQIQPNLIKAFFDEQNILSFVFINTDGQLCSKLLSNSAIAQNFINNLANHYFINVKQDLQTDVYQCMYRRDLSAALNAIIEGIKTALKSKSIDVAEQSFKYFDNCIEYLKTQDMKEVGLKSLNDKISIYEHLEQMYKLIPLNMNPSFCIHPTVPDTIQHTQYSLLIQLQKQLRTNQFNNAIYQQCLDFVSKNPGLIDSNLLSSIMDVSMKFNLLGFSQQNLALELLKMLQKSSIEKITFRAVMPSIFCNSVIKDCFLTKILEDGFQQQPAKFNFDSVTTQQLQGLYSQEDEHEVLSLTKNSLIVKYFQLPTMNYQQYLALVKSLRQDYILKDVLIEQIQIGDLFAKQQVIDQPTLLVFIAHLFAANDLESIAKLLSCTTQVIRQMYNSEPHKNIYQNKPAMFQEVCGCNLKFYQYLAYIVSIFWRIYIAQYQKQYGSYIDIESAQVQLEVLVKYLQDPFLATNISQNCINEEYNVVSNLKPISVILKQMCQQVKKGNKDAEYGFEAIKNLQAALLIVEGFDYENLSTCVLDLISFYKGK